MPGRLEPEFRSLMALQAYGIGVPLKADAPIKFASFRTEELVAVAEKHGARIVFTSIHAPDVEAAFIRQYLSDLGLPGMANCLSENWCTSMGRSSSRTEEISRWLGHFGSSEDAYVIIDTDRFAAELMESSFSEHVVIIDSEIPDYSAAAERVRHALETGAGHA